MKSSQSNHTYGVSLSTNALEGGILHVMSTPPYLPKPTAKATLSPEQRARCLRVAQRIHADLGALVDRLPEHARGGSGMSRHLDVVRNTCQRVAHALSDAEPSIDTLVRLPGTKGLEQLVEAIAAHGIDPHLCENATTAIGQFDALIRDNGGSHAKLIARIESATNPEVPLELGSLRARQELFKSAVGITGRSAQTTISLYAFRQSAESPDVLQRAIASGLIQTTVVPGGMPVVISNGNTLHWDDDPDDSLKNLDDSVAQGSTPEALLKEFCSHPLPTVTSRGTAGSMIRVIDPQSLDGPQTFDVLSAARSNHPYLDPQGEPVFNEIWSLANCPSTRLIFDIYLHADMESRFRPSIDAQQWYPNLSAPGGDRWVLRYPNVPTLELLGRGLGNSASSGYPRHAELTRVFFDRMGWDAGEFFGFRCEVEYPVWRGGYCMKFTPIPGG